jgi:hypothetical protein
MQQMYDFVIGAKKANSSWRANGAARQRAEKMSKSAIDARI